MPRKTYVTRSVKLTTARVMVVGLKEKEVYETELTLSSICHHKEQTLKKLKKEYDSEELKVLEVIDFDVETKLIGMPLDDFINDSVVLDPKTRQPYAEGATFSYDVESE